MCPIVPSPSCLSLTVNSDECWVDAGSSSIQPNPQNKSISTHFRVSCIVLALPASFTLSFAPFHFVIELCPHYSYLLHQRLLHLMTFNCFWLVGSRVISLVFVSWETQRWARHQKSLDWLHLHSMIQYYLRLFNGVNLICCCYAKAFLIHFNNLISI